MKAREGAAVWVRAGRLEDIPRLGARLVRSPAGDIALFRTAKDETFALEDRCPHRGGPLSEGIVFGARVACPLHDWVIELRSGLALAPDCGRAKTYPVRVEDGVVWLMPVPYTDNGDGPHG